MFRGKVVWQKKHYLYSVFNYYTCVFKRNANDRLII